MDDAPGIGESLGEWRTDQLVLNLFADATSVARALGIDVDLPDSNRQDPEYWDRVHADGGCKRRILVEVALRDSDRDQQGRVRPAMEAEGYAVAWTEFCWEPGPGFRWEAQPGRG